MPWVRNLKERAVSKVHNRLGLRTFFLGLVVGFSLSLGLVSIALHYEERKRRRREVNLPDSTTRFIELRNDDVVDGVVGLIGEGIRKSKNTTCTDNFPGNTPLVRIKSLSDALGVEILGKAEVSRNIRHQSL